jgi:hypothetical protein
MPLRNDGEAMDTGRQLIRPVHGVLEHRPASDETAILLGPMAPEPVLDEQSRPLSLAARQYDGTLHLDPLSDEAERTRAALGHWTLST